MQIERPTIPSPTDGQLGRCSSEVREAFARLHIALTAIGLAVEPLLRQGEWLAGSYKQGRQRIVGVHPKTDWIKVQLDEIAASSAPHRLRPVGEVRGD